MRVIKVFNAKRAAVIAFCAVLSVLACLRSGILVGSETDVSGTFSQASEYEVRSRLLIEAVNKVGVCEPERAVNVWANGLMQRNAAMQYSVMTRALKAQYVKDLEINAPNWVTGVSSPWINGYEVLKAQKQNDNSYLFELRISTASSAGPAGDYNAKLAVTREDGFWRIARLSTDEGLLPYTGFRDTKAGTSALLAD
jgi:hypothetical protein